MSDVSFPSDFVWGAATASYQIEGAFDEDGRGPSIWDTFSHLPGKVHRGDNGDIACDHYHLWPMDLDLMKELGLHSYRFSIAWPRIQPTGKGPANQVGLDFYRRLVEGLGERGIEASATLYHWDLPQALEDAGGWRVRDTAERFGEYSSIVGEALGDSVTRWITLNEPWCSSWLGYGMGLHAPGDLSVAAALDANHHLLLGHGFAVDALRTFSSAPVGITLNLAVVRAASEHPDDKAAAQRVEGNANRLFLDPIFRGAYPRDMSDHYSKYPSPVRAGDLEVISRPLDFLGVNFYHPTTVCDRDRVEEARAFGYLVDTTKSPDPVEADLRVVHVGRPGVPRTSTEWEIEGGALKELLVYVGESYTDLPLYITENGCSCEDYIDPNGAINDVDRIDYIDQHLRAVHSAIEDGVDVKGYFVWSLFDNFEWAKGYAKRFGIVWVDYDTHRRVPKQSFRWYQEVIRTNSLASHGKVKVSDVD